MIPSFHPLSRSVPMTTNPQRCRPPRTAALAGAAAIACLAGCASNGDKTRGDQAGINVKDPIDHFANNFELDRESGRMVAKGGNRFETGTTDAFNRSFDVEAFNRKAFNAAQFGARREFDVTDRNPAEPVSDLMSQRSRLAGLAADESGSTAEGLSRSRFEGTAADTPGGYRGASGNYRTGDFDQATRALNEAAVGNAGAEADETDMSIEDISRLLNKGS